LIKNEESSTAITVHYVKDVPAEKHNQIQSEINDLYQLLEAFCLQYNIPKEDHSIKRELNTGATFLWVDLVNSNVKS
jgi:hypothetical protein